jgi:DNA-binding phage protein
MKAARPHDVAMVELLREDPAFADEYLAAALEEAEEPGGRQACCAPCATSPMPKECKR